MKQGDREPFLQTNYHNTRFISCQISKHQNAQCKPNDRIKKKKQLAKNVFRYIFPAKKEHTKQEYSTKKSPLFRIFV